MTGPFVTFTPDPVVLPRVRQLLLLGFAPHEMLQPLERHAGRSVPPAEIELTIDAVHEAWDANPESAQMRQAQSALWARSEMFRSDMLAMYGDLLANARATLEGQFNHPDGRPVITTKPREVQTFADAIIKAEREAVEDQRQALRFGGSPPPAAALSDPTATHDEDDDWGSETPARTEL